MLLKARKIGEKNREPGLIDLFQVKSAHHEPFFHFISNECLEHSVVISEMTALIEHSLGNLYYSQYYIVSI